MRRAQLLITLAALALLVTLWVNATSSTVRAGTAGGGRFAAAGHGDQEGLLAAVRRTELAEARAVAAEARAAAAEARAAQPTAAGAVAAGANRGTATDARSAPDASATPGEPDDTEINRKMRAALSAVANARGEVMLALTNDVMMCTNRKTCWWSGGNILETFLQQARRAFLTRPYPILTYSILSSPRAYSPLMCTNRKTCWWNGGNILETFLQQARLAFLKRPFLSILFYPPVAHTCIFTVEPAAFTIS
jgi:hypothetical protein